LYKIPISLPRRDVFILEGIRYAIGIIDDSINRLKSTLLKASINSELGTKYYYIIFKEAWTLVDFSWRFRNLLRQIGKFEDEVGDDKLVNENKVLIDLRPLDILKDFRHTLQHLDERIEEVFVDENAYVWGNISWLYVINENTVHSYLLSPGYPRSSVEMINPSGLLVNRQLCNIMLQSMNRKKEKIKLNISVLIDDVTTIVKQFENVIAPQFKERNNNQTFGQDLIISMKLKGANNKS